MKKMLKKVLLTIILLLPITVLADGNITVSPSSLEIEVGSTKTFTISAYNTIGDVTISSNNSSIATVSSNEWGTGMVEEKQTKTGTITVTGVSVGTTSITLTLDAATFDGDDLAGQTRTINVTVKEKPEPVPEPKPEPTPEPASDPKPEPTPSPSNNSSGSNNNNSNSNNNNSNNTKKEEKSTNNKLKELTIDGQKVEKKDDNNYTSVVLNNVTSINIKAISEDSKAKVTGDGKKDLKVGENTFEIVITSESGTANKIVIKVTRKDGFYLEDLEDALKDSSIKSIDINIKDGEVISKEDLNKIRNSKKIVNLNYYDSSKKLLYSIILDGAKINSSNEFVATISNTSENSNLIGELAGNSNGMYAVTKGNLPSATKIKLYVGNKYKNGVIVNVYYYDKTNNKLDSLKNGIKVTNGYIEFENNSNFNEYYILSKNALNDSVGQEKDKSINIFLIISIIEFVIIVLLLVYFIVIKPKLDKKSSLKKFNNAVNNYYEDKAVSNEDDIINYHSNNLNHSQGNPNNSNNDTSNNNFNDFTLD